MDKFGIFNLLNSFFPLTKSENGQNTPDSPTTNDLLGNLLSSLSNNKKVETDNKKATLSTPLPLQSSMLSTINSHDQIVKRVRENSSKHTVLKN